MSDTTKLVIRISVAALCLFATVQSLTAIYSDISELEKTAANLACGKDSCVTRLELERTPFAQRFVFQVSIDPPTKVEVRCERSLVLFGDYACAVSGPAH
ncbi:MAG TPA: hypothetical protein VL137_01860 [Polyangiaceae bacterium]|jgi:hypothetical protein|nr:hypothetical protein [Polyangiaceae bacterium]